MVEASLEIQWLRIHLPKQGVHVQSLVREALQPKNNINKRFPNHNSRVEGKIIKAIAVMQLMLKETRNQKILLIRTK